jgi:DNA-binding transcriptional ArsR family regulator
LEPISGIELLILSKLHRRVGRISTNEMQRELHLQKNSVGQALNSLTDRGLIKRTAVPKSKGGAVSQTNYYSLTEESEIPEIDGTVSIHGLSGVLNFVRKCSNLELSRLHPAVSSDRIKVGKWPFTVFTKREKLRMREEISKIEKQHWAQSKNSIETIYSTAMNEFSQVLQLFLAELIALDVLYRARFITSNDFKKSFVKLSQMYFGSHLSGELSNVIIRAFIQLAYPNINSTELGINLAREFRQQASKPT